MNPIEIDRALRKLRLSGMADTLATRLVQAQAEGQAPIDFLSALVGDELQRRQDPASSRRASATPTRPSTPSTSPSTRR